MLKDLAADAAARRRHPRTGDLQPVRDQRRQHRPDALRLADDIGADNVVIHLDTYHMNIEEDDLVRPVCDAGDRLGYVHIGENHRGYLGSGHLDFTAFFGALATVNYRGPVTFESFSSAVVAPGLSNDLAIWRNLWDDGADLAVHARGSSPTTCTPAGDPMNLEDLVARVGRGMPPRRRPFLGMAGAPGAGKTTLVESLIRELNKDAPEPETQEFAHVPMDGFHLSDQELTPPWHP